MKNKKPLSKSTSKLKTLEERLANFNPKLHGGEVMTTRKLLGAEIVVNVLYLT